MATAFHLRAMPPTNATLNGLVGASLVAASFHLCTMSYTNSSRFGFFGASLMAAAFLICVRAMRDANSASNNSIGASGVATAFFTHSC